MPTVITPEPIPLVNSLQEFVDIPPIPQVQSCKPESHSSGWTRLQGHVDEMSNKRQGLRENSALQAYFQMHLQVLSHTVP